MIILFSDVRKWAQEPREISIVDTNVRFIQLKLFHVVLSKTTLVGDQFLHRLIYLSETDCWYEEALSTI